MKKNVIAVFLILFSCPLLSMGRARISPTLAARLQLKKITSIEQAEKIRAINENNLFFEGVKARYATSFRYSRELEMQNQNAEKKQSYLSLIRSDSRNKALREQSDRRNKELRKQYDYQNNYYNALSIRGFKKEMDDYIESLKKEKE